MINSMQKALIIKDLRAITANKRMFSVMIIIPLVMVVFLPTLFILIFALTGDFQEVLSTVNIGGADPKDFMLNMLINGIIPMYFLMIPIMAASVMAASSFVGEKEKRTLETLLYCPLTLRQIYRAKVLASFLMSMAVSLMSFIVMTIVVGLESHFLLGELILPGLNWLILLVLISPALTMIAISIIVRGSAKARSVEESQQRSVFLILPVILAATTQFMGVLIIDELIMLVAGVVLAAIAWWFAGGASKGFDYETLLKV
jgi:ABC-type Na+ efflux pump permease subunit